MVLWGCPTPRGSLSVSSVSPEEHGIEGPVPQPPGGPLVGRAQPPVHLPHQGEGLLPQRVRDRAPVPVSRPGPLCPSRRLPSLPLCLWRRCRAPPTLRRGHPRRLRSRGGGGWLVLGLWGLGGLSHFSPRPGSRRPGFADVEPKVLIRYYYHSYGAQFLCWRLSLGEDGKSPTY